jgi:hypothetical protein
VNDCLDCQRPVEDRTLCESCSARLDGRLADLGGFYRALAEFLAPGSSGGGPIGRTKSPDAPLPVVEDVLSLRGPGGLLGVVEDWVAALWVGELPAPAGGYEARVDAGVATLRRMLPYISTGWPEAGTFADEIRKLHAEARSIVDPSPKPIRAGYCTATVEDGSECGAVLLWQQGDRGLICRWCQHEYPASAWLSLAEAN